MAIEVPEMIKKETYRCPRELGCTATAPGGNQPKCKVDFSGRRNVLFVAASKDHLSCPYLILLGNGRICTCPIHYYLCNTTAAT